MILVTGANGFLGKEIVKILRAKQIKLRLIVREKKIFSQNKLNGEEIIEVNNIFKLSEDELMNLFQGVDLVIHTAWYSGSKDTYSSYKNIECHIGTIKMVMAAKKAGIKKFVGIGSCSEYDDSKFIVDTKSKILPKTLYAASKVSTFFMAKEILKGSITKFLWCRIFFMYGEGDKPYKLSQYIEACLGKGEKAYVRSSRKIRDFIKVDKASALITDASLDDSHGILNICSGIPKTIREFVLEIAEPVCKTNLIEFGDTQADDYDPICIVGKIE